MAFSASYVNGRTIRDALVGTAMNLDTNTFRVALFTNAITGQDKNASESYGAGAYASGEVASVGYTAGGGSEGTIVNPNITTPASGKWIFKDTTELESTRVWGDEIEDGGATFVTRGAVIYNTTVSNRVLAAINFGADIMVADGTFTISWDPTNGIFYATY